MARISWRSPDLPGMAGIRLGPGKSEAGTRVDTRSIASSGQLVDISSTKPVLYLRLVEPYPERVTI